MPELPVCTVGVAPKHPPGAQRGVPQRGDLGVPPEIRRRTGTVHTAPESVAAAANIRRALRKAQLTLLGAQSKLQLSAVKVRTRIASRH